MLDDVYISIITAIASVPNIEIFGTILFETFVVAIAITNVFSKISTITAISGKE
jgi:hypothetical protein